MKRRFLSVLLACCLLVPCVPSLAFEAEVETGFSDVSPDDWFAPYVEVCVEEGLMQGTGDGMFSPNKNLSLAETLALAVRVNTASTPSFRRFGGWNRTPRPLLCRKIWRIWFDFTMRMAN